MWSFSQDLTAILVKQEPSVLSEPPAASPVHNVAPQPLTLAPPPQRHSVEEKVGLWPFHGVWLMRALCLGGMRAWMPLFKWRCPLLCTCTVFTHTLTIGHISKGWAPYRKLIQSYEVTHFKTCKLSTATFYDILTKRLAWQDINGRQMTWRTFTCVL